MGENFNASEVRKSVRGTDSSHIWRYYLARGFVEPGDFVNDVACGYGYGSNILSRSQAALVRGVDYDTDALAFAKGKYGSDRVEFFERDLDSLQGSLPQCDVTISIETIEHLDDPKAFAAALKSSTRRYILITTPIVPTTQEALGPEKGSPYHHHDLSIVDLNNTFIDEEWNIIGDAIIGQHGLVVYEKS